VQRWWLLCSVHVDAVFYYALRYYSLIRAYDPTNCYNDALCYRAPMSLGYKLLREIIVSLCFQTMIENFQ
jgi:hypothetical protein